MTLEQCSLLSCSTCASSFPLRFHRTDAAQLTAPGPCGHQAFAAVALSQGAVESALPGPLSNLRKDPVALVPNVELPGQ